MKLTKVVAFFMFTIIHVFVLQLSAFSAKAVCDDVHSYGEWVQVAAPLCNAEGKDMRTCNLCGQIEYRDTRSHGTQNLVQVSDPLASDYFEGKSIVCVGDSITYGSGAKKNVNDYVTVLGKLLGGANMTKKALAGSVLSTGGHKTCNIYQLDSIPAYPDVVTIYMGVNDWDHGRNGNGEYYYDLGELGCADTTTIYGAAKMWCDRVEELRAQPEYANSKFIFITPTITSWNLSMGNIKDDWNQTKTNIHGFTLRHVCNAIMETCAEYNIPVLDLNLYSGLYYISEDNNNVENTYYDGIHPNPAGHNMIAEAIAEFLLDNYTIQEREVKDNGHSYIEKPEISATCVTDGVSEGKVCTVCGEVKVVSRKIPAKGHSEVLTPDVKPGVLTPGYKGGTHCSVCDEILTNPELVLPTGVSVKATLNKEGNLTVSGALSDDPIADGTTFIAVYKANGALLGVKNITDLNHTGFSSFIEGMKEADSVKILRLDMLTLHTLYDTVEVSVDRD